MFITYDTVLMHGYIQIYLPIIIRAETNIRFARMFARLHKYSNTKKVFGYTENDFSALFLTYFVINYKFKVFQ